MIMTVIEKEKMKSSSWSGGVTTEIAIFPENAVYAERDFIYRISTASVEADESDFTPLPDYDRIIALLDGGAHLTHCTPGGVEEAELVPLVTVHGFDGGAATHCVGRARDVNLMLRKGVASGSIEFIRGNSAVRIALAENERALIYDFDSGTAYAFAPDADGGETVFPARDGGCVMFGIRLCR